MEKNVAIVGAGISGLLACKYVLEIGFHPIVYEADDEIGGIWRHTIQSTKLQTNKESFQFSDFPWDSSVKEDCPSNQQVLHYVNSYAQHFSIIPYIRFNSKVIDIDYVGIGQSNEDINSWELWSGNGSPFSTKGTWHLTVQDTKNFTTEVQKAEFVILCIGKYSGFPNIPEFPFRKGPKVFKGKVIHSMDYSALGNENAAELIKDKRVTIVGSGKSALDIAAECANANGVAHPCTIIQRSIHWFIPDFKIGGINLGFLYFNRFAELSLHKPGEPFLLSLVATLLSPLRMGISKLVETYLRWKLPLKKYELIPNHSFLQDTTACRTGILPDFFFDKVKNGSIVIKKSQSFSFHKDGLIINGESKPHETDLVILATGYKGDQKLRSIFRSSIFQNYMNGSINSAIPLYRQIIHPRIPQLAIIGYDEGLSSILSNEMRCQWLAHLLNENIQLPTIREMEKDIKLWEDNMKQNTKNFNSRSCIVTCGIWYNDQLCKDMKCNHLRKKNIFAELFEPYGPTDYNGLLHKCL
ncbi:flavin-containing monooxygenase [Trifolium repens]|nr:flavin-containing monooxygenase [Trifolium repens]